LKVGFKPLNVAFNLPPRYRARAESSVQVLYKATFSLWDKPPPAAIAGTSANQRDDANARESRDQGHRGLPLQRPVMPVRPRSEIQARASVVKALPQ